MRRRVYEISYADWRNNILVFRSGTDEHGYAYGRSYPATERNLNRVRNIPGAYEGALGGIWVSRKRYEKAK